MCVVADTSVVGWSSSVKSALAMAENVGLGISSEGGLLLVEEGKVDET